MSESILISYPIPLINKSIVLENVSEMIRKAERCGATFRPHFKTHQSKRIGEWLRPLGIDKITVSSTKMALFYAENGWNDIVIAFPAQLGAVNDYNLLLKKNIKFVC